MDNTIVVVIDTNVMVSGLKSSSGASFRVLDRIRLGQIVPAVTVPLVLEYDDVANRPGLLPHLLPAEIAGFLDWFVSISRQHLVHYLWRPLLRDPKDDMVLEAAVTAGANFLITHNTRDFEEAAGVGVSVLTPQQLLRLV